MLVLSGADAISVFIRATLVPLVVPQDMRGRVLAVENVFIGGSNELGAFESGVAGQVLGPAGAIVLGGAATLAIAGTWWVAFPALRDVDRFPGGGQPPSPWTKPSSRNWARDRTRGLAGPPAKMRSLGPRTDGGHGASVARFLEQAPRPRSRGPGRRAATASATGPTTSPGRPGRHLASLARQANFRANIWSDGVGERVGPPVRQRDRVVHQLAGFTATQHGDVPRASPLSGERRRRST